MKTANERASEAVAFMSQIHTTADPILDTGKSLLETLFEEAMLDAWKQGMTDAMHIVDGAHGQSVNQLGWAAKTIIATRDNKTTL